MDEWTYKILNNIDKALLDMNNRITVVEEMLKVKQPAQPQQPEQTQQPVK